MNEERYELMDVIGSGGMATVWRARDTRLGRIVAIKRPHPAPADSTVLPRFAREARAAAVVSHRHLVSVYDVGEDAVGPYLVMEYVDGPSLALANVPRERAATLGIQLAAALSALHAAGVVHGDVKPGNILIAGADAKLTDFGIARTVDDPTLTSEGIALGTAAYSAPETLATGVRSPAADVYSLAAVLHELLTGSRWKPNAGATQPLPPPAWRAVLAPALSLDARRRPTAAAFEQALRRLDEADVPTTAVAAVAAPVDAGRGTRTASLILLAILAGATAVGGVVAMANSGDGDVATASTQPVAATIDGDPAAAPAPADVPATTIAPPPATTTPPATVVTTTLPPPPPPSTTPASLAKAVAVAGGLVDLIEAAQPDHLPAAAGSELIRGVADTLRAANGGDAKQATKHLRSLFQRAEREVRDDDTRDEILEQVIELSVALDLDPEAVAGPGRGRASDEWYSWFTDLFSSGDDRG